MSDPLAKIKKKLQDEIDQLSHELSVELPKEIAVARAHGDLSETPSTSTPRNARATSTSRSAISKSAWAISAC